MTSLLRECGTARNMPSPRLKAPCSTNSVSNTTNVEEAPHSAPSTLAEQEALTFCYHQERQLVQ